MRLFLPCLLLLSMPIASTASAEGLKVVANTERNIQLSREQVRNLYMGATLGYGLKPVALPASNRHRSMFNTRVIGLAEARIQSYWAQMRFTGRLRPPTIRLPGRPSRRRRLSASLVSVARSPDCVVPNRLTMLYQAD